MSKNERSGGDFQPGCQVLICRDGDLALQVRLEGRAAGVARDDADVDGEDD